MNYPERMRDIAVMLEADGYELAAEEVGHRLAVTISPTPTACEDCLVPKNVFRGIVSSSMGIADDLIDVTYPADLPGYTGTPH